MNDDVLKESLLDLYEHAPCGYIFTMPDGSFAHVNETFLQWIGYTREDLHGRRFQDLLTVPGKIFYENQYAPLLQMQGAVGEIAFDLVRRDGTRLPALINSVLRSDDAGSPLLVASTIFSASERRAYERELLMERSRAEQLARVVTASSEAIITCSADGMVQTWNQSAERLFGYPSGTFTTLTLRELLPFGDGDEFDHVMRSLRAGSSVHADTVARAANDEPIDVSVSITPHSDELGALASLSAIVRDVRDRRAIERLQHEFLAMASHELRTPLVAIRGHAQLMQRRREYNEAGIETIIAQTRTLSRLIDDLLVASQLEADRLTLYPAELDLVDVAKDAVRLVETHGRGINVDAPDEPVLIRADRQRLDQVFGNLLSNAVKYSPEDTDIEVQVAVRGAQARVDVVDHGIGIGDDDLPNLFDRFYRSATAAEQTQGTGLGLYITRRIVERHGGAIRVESTAGEGSRFIVTFPLAH